MSDSDPRTISALSLFSEVTPTAFCPRRSFSRVTYTSRTESATSSARAFSSWISSIRPVPAITEASLSIAFSRSLTSARFSSLQVRMSRLLAASATTLKVSIGLSTPPARRAESIRSRINCWSLGARAATSAPGTGSTCSPTV